ncbi:MAG: hypothetical protein JSW20_01895 [Nitrospiraceae bacterium]|nr:MAG: hypothetical protein JSW20_01895 [Nitrospiraceae bacterium]
MAEIRSREQEPVPGITYSEIHIPDESILGTGTFITVLEEGAFGKKNPIISSVMNEPVFVLILSLNIAIASATAMIGKSQNTPPLDRKVFNIPKNIDSTGVLSFEVSFKDWDIIGIDLNGKKLANAE